MSKSDMEHDIAIEALGKVNWTLISLDGGFFYQTLEVDMGNDEESFDKAWNTYLRPIITEQDALLTLRPDQVEELRDLLNDMVDKGEHDGTNE
jgi:hypothetical protein